MRGSFVITHEQEESQLDQVGENIKIFVKQSLPIQHTCTHCTEYAVAELVGGGVAES